MSNVFKSIGKGILYFFLFPVIVLAIAIYAVVGLGVFIFQFVKMIILFFSGRNLNSDLDEDIKAKSILGELQVDEEKEESPLSLYPSDSPVYGSGYSSPLFPEQSKEEVAPSIEPEPEEVEIEDEIVVETEEGEKNEY